MPNEINRRPAPRVVPRSQNMRRKRKKRRRGPIMKFRFSGIILIWVFSLIGCFGFYMVKRNIAPDEDIWIKKASAEESSLSETTTPAVTTAAAGAKPSGTVTTAAEGSKPSGAAETTAANNEGGDPAETAAANPGDKANPVPEGAPQPQDYLVWSAFVGEKSVYDMGQQGLLSTYNVYSSETLTLENYTSEYIMLNGTTIKILSALNSAKCPIYLMFGTEDLLTLKSEKVVDRFGVLLNQVKAAAPASEIYVLAAPPVTYKQEKSKNGLTNTKIDDYNSLLLSVCKQANVYFIDINTALKNNEGRLDDGFAQDDGIHLNTDGSQLLLNYVLTHVPAEAKYRKSTN